MRRGCSETRGWEPWFQGLGVASLGSPTRTTWKSWEIPILLEDLVCARPGCSALPGSSEPARVWKEFPDLKAPLSIPTPEPRHLAAGLALPFPWINCDLGSQQSWPTQGGQSLGEAWGTQRWEDARVWQFLQDRVWAWEVQSQAGDSEQVSCAWDHACLEILELLGLPGRARQSLEVQTG